MSETLKPCPCGKTPAALSVVAEDQAKWGYVAGDCCGEWTIEFRLQYLRLNDPERMALAIEAWNKADRGPASREGAREQARRLLSDMAADARGDEPHIPLPPTPEGFYQGFEDGYVAGYNAAPPAAPAEPPAKEVVVTREGNDGSFTVTQWERVAAAEVVVYPGTQDRRVVRLLAAGESLPHGTRLYADPQHPAPVDPSGKRSEAGGGTK